MGKQKHLLFLDRFLGRPSTGPHGLLLFTPFAFGNISSSLRQRIISLQRRKLKSPICDLCCNETYKRDQGFESAAVEAEVLTKSAEHCRFCALICDLFVAAVTTWEKQKRDIEYFEGEWKKQKIRVQFRGPGQPPFIIYNNDAGIYVFFPRNLDMTPPHPKLPLWPSVLEHAGSESSLQLAKSWLHRCLREHPDCADTSSVEMPLRVVRIQARDTQPKTFQLQLFETMGQQGQYVALSHCWGKQQPLRTERGNLEELKRDIPWSALPLTFQDAIRITDFLGYSYIWIDSLCIVQDNYADWETQSALMGRIYENSILTIIACSASGHEQGILVPRKLLFAGTAMLGGEFSGSSPTPVRFQEFISHDFVPSPFSNDPSDPLDKRAWTYQERLMSTRSLIYSTQELKWECNSMHCCECDLSDQDLKGKSHPFSIQNIVQCDREDALNYWYSKVVRIYSGRKLTKGTDRLPALSGVAARLMDRIGGRYVAGIWENDMIRGLCWDASHFGIYTVSLCPEYQAPSFSWASIQRPAYYSSLEVEGRVALTKLVEASCTLVGSNPFGHVKDASILVEGPITSAWIRWPLKWDGTGARELTWNIEKPGVEDSIHSSFWFADTHLSVSSLPETYPIEDWYKGSDVTPHRAFVEECTDSEDWTDWYGCQCLLLWTKYSRGHEDYLEYYLVLGLSLLKPGAFERLGVCKINSMDADTKIWERARVRRLTIV